MKYKTVSVVCGQCGRRIGETNPDIKTKQIYNCRKCWKRNVYDPSTRTCTVKEIPQRATSSGMTFI